MGSSIWMPLANITNFQANTHWPRWPRITTPTLGKKGDFGFTAATTVAFIYILFPICLLLDSLSFEIPEALALTYSPNSLQG